MKPVAILSRSLSKGKIGLVHQAALTALTCAIAGAALAQTGSTDIPPTAARQFPAMGLTREIKLAENTWVRFGFQVQAWLKAAQDRIVQPDGSDGTFAVDMYCRRCRIFATGSIVKDITYNILLESGNSGKGDPTTGAKPFPLAMLDAYGMIKFADAFYLSGGSILMPLTRNGLQPTTTYLSIDVANVSTTPVAQGNSNVLRDLGFQASGYFLEDHLEYRLGVWQGSRAAATPTHTASHNPPRVIAMLAYNFWDTEKGYVNGGHYYGTKKVLGLMANFDYQTFRKADPPLTGGPAGIGKNPYYGFSTAAFINYPLSGRGDPKGGDEVVALAQFGYYDGGFDPSPGSTNQPTYPAVLKQADFLAEAAYYNKDLKPSFFGKFELRKINAIYDTVPGLKPNNNVMWIAGGLKYYVAPANLCNIGLQYERIQFQDALPNQQAGTHNVTLQMQFLLY